MQPGRGGLLPVAKVALDSIADHRIEFEEADGRVRVVVELPARFRAEGAT